MVEDKNYMKHLLNERITKTFSTDMQTLGMIKDFMVKYHSNSLSKAVDDLVNVGLANFGYRTQQEIEARFKSSGFSPERITVPEPKLKLKPEPKPELKPKIADPKIMASILSPSQYELERLIMKIITQLCKESGDNSANEIDILNKAKSQGIKLIKIEEALNRLLRDGEIYRTPKGNYGIN